MQLRPIGGSTAPKRPTANAPLPGRRQDVRQEPIRACSACGCDARIDRRARTSFRRVVKIGVLTDMNGPASTPTGQGSVTAAQMAIDDFGGKVLGKPISIIVGDHRLNPDIGGALRGAGTMSIRSI